MCQFSSGTCTCSVGRVWVNQTNSCQCQHGLFGNSCTEKCNTYCKDSGCNEVSGACAIGCISGYYGPDCSKKCVGCDNCDEKGTCPLKPDKNTDIMIDMDIMAASSVYDGYESVSFKSKPGNKQPEESKALASEDTILPDLGPRMAVSS
ncbi:hypothetical protein MAR_037318 [Mya arenaria]|uniref:Uncharacterized protein n=1 Tax=Mya arenaria TaxID=6604 RepID=A0ABY7FR65_MYAAR|nr:hypothetical protein MAR_037318 [Mya arenaria]